MAKFVYIYAGGQRADTPEAQEQAYAQWAAWFGTLGNAVVDRGNPFAESVTVKSGGSGSGASATGYSVVTAGSLQEAATQAESCPILQTGGTVEVYEAVEM